MLTGQAVVLPPFFSIRERLLPQCFNPNCDETFDSVNEMVAVPGRGGRSPRHFCEDCAERIRRGPPMTDGGTDRPDPAEDPRACSVCGVYIGFGGDEYCDGCAREIGAKPPLARCMGCGQDAPQEQMNAIDVSPEDEYYPDIRYVCPGCEGGGADGA